MAAASLGYSEGSLLLCHKGKDCSEQHLSCHFSGRSISWYLECGTHG